MHIFLYRLKILLRTKAMIFWTMAFPIILATFFYLAFSNLDNESTFKEIKVGFVENIDTNFKMLITELASEEHKLFNLTEYSDLNKAKVALEKKEIVGYYYLNKNLNITVKKNGIEETIIKAVLDNYLQTNSVIGNIIELSGPKEIPKIIEMVYSDINYFKSVNQKNISIIVIYFYSLIAMTCFYGGSLGVSAAVETEANLSKRAARTSVSPNHKLKILLGNLGAGFLIHLFSILILLFYLMFILKIYFGSQTGYIFLIAILGSFAGNAFGLFVGLANKKSEDAKIGIVISITMFLTFLAGMMVAQMKYIIETNAPFLARINPVAAISDGLYSLYYYTELTRYWNNVMMLIVFSLIMIVASFIIIRRKNYDSI